LKERDANLLKNISKFFDSHGQIWIDAYRSQDGAWYEYYPLRLREKYALSLIEDENKGTVIDLGCGAGSALVKMKKMGFKTVVGVDISENMLSTARKFISDNNLADSIDLVKGDVQKLPRIGSNSVDVCTALGVIEYLQEDKPFLTEINRILKPNGVAVIQTRNCNCIRTWTVESVRKIFPLFRSKIAYRVHRPLEFRPIIKACGFRIESEKYSHYYALYPFDIIPGVRHILKPVDNLLSKRLEIFSSNPISRYFASMYILKLRKVVATNGYN
jgi:ubiquinone/menaquinone biosynthesis C-methylase UbiE